MKIEGIDFHHTADTSPDPQFLKVNAFHKKEGFPLSNFGFYIGYQYFIGRDGTIKQGRSENERGAHTVNCGCAHDKSGLPEDTANLHYIGICLAGNFLFEKPTDAQMASLFVLTEEIQKRHNIPDSKLLNHRDLKPTSCPGIDIAAELMKIKELRKQLFAAQNALNRVTPARREKLVKFIYATMQKLSKFMSYLQA